MRLYNAERPMRYSQVIGQKETMATIKTMAEKNQIPQVCLFVGVRGTGKTTVARILAKHLNCEHPTADGPCLECASCKEALGDTNVDIHEMDAASHNGVADIHDLLEQLQYSPLRNYKVFIIDEVHMLSTAAFNALLKTLEEPPKGCFFFLCTTELHKVPATILSRCARFDFKRIDGQQIKEHLEHVCKKYQVSYEPDALTLIARAADGGMRDALSILEKFMLCPSITTDTVANTLGIPKEDRLIGTLMGLFSGDVAEMLRNFQVTVSNGSNLLLFIKDMLELLSDVLFVKNGGSIQSLVHTTEHKHGVETIAGMVTTEQLLHVIDTLSSITGTSTELPFVLESRLLSCFTRESSLSRLQAEVANLKQEVEALKAGISISDTPAAQTTISNITPFVSKETTVEAELSLQNMGEGDMQEEDENATPEEDENDFLGMSDTDIDSMIRCAEESFAGIGEIKGTISFDEISDDLPEDSNALSEESYYEQMTQAELHTTEPEEEQALPAATMEEDNTESEETEAFSAFDDFGMGGLARLLQF